MAFANAKAPFLALAVVGFSFGLYVITFSNLGEAFRQRVFQADLSYMRSSNNQRC